MTVAEPADARHPLQANSDLPVAAWACDIAEACYERSLPLAMLIALVRDDAESSGDWRHLRQQKSVAGKLGAALGGIWRRPKFAGEALSKLTSRMSELDELVDRLEKLVFALGDQQAGIYLEPPRIVSDTP